MCLQGVPAKPEMSISIVGCMLCLPKHTMHTSICDNMDRSGGGVCIQMTTVVSLQVSALLGLPQTQLALQREQNLLLQC